MWESTLHIITNVRVDTLHSVTNVGVDTAELLLCGVAIVGVGTADSCCCKCRHCRASPLHGSTLMGLVLTRGDFI